MGMTAETLSGPAPDTAGPERLRCDAARNRERVLSAASEVYGERGPAFTMEEIASRAGVGIGTVYRRFPTKGALLDAIALPCLERILNLARAAGEHREPGERLETFVRTFAERHASERMGSGRLWDSTLGRPLRDEIARVVDGLLDAARKAGRLRPDVTYRDVSVLLWTLTSLIDATDRVAPTVWHRHLDLVLDGLRPDGPRPLATPPTDAEEWEKVVTSSAALRLR
ncbi:TetR/AcrR family transcriptional regulator [Protofrankia symbiont of Coriaria ruscifolia]|uniref:TetR/AcrR family transcriptional regulator n=1 Tax=Protofrankia symbiont of Coriaria ruscifolia TaxID=1306542 RepID=UPI001F5EB9D3|nr:TetR/AcrR family transcriptional regulator [Protofrankia symbiont of Coriaria ruscifolia]